MIVRCFNVGQGNCILIELPPDDYHRSSRFGLIDCFYTRERLKEPRVLTYLKSRGVTSLEFVALTHPDEDHCTGLSQVLEYYSSDGRQFKTFIESVYDCESVRGINFLRKAQFGKIRPKLTPHAAELQRIADLTIIPFMNGVATFRYEAMGHAFSSYPLTDDLKLLFMAPNNKAFRQFTALRLKNLRALQKDKRVSALNLNDVCLAFQLVYGEAKVLICGDVTSGVWTDVVIESRQAKVPLKSDFVAVTHHGAETGNPSALWDEIVSEPPHKTSAIISCGYRNRHDHPAASTLNKILSRPASLYCINLGAPCAGYDVISHKKKSAVERAIEEINRKPLERALSTIGTSINQICSGDCDFRISKTGQVTLLRRQQDSHCAYAAKHRGLANDY